MTVHVPVAANCPAIETAPFPLTMKLLLAFWNETVVPVELDWIVVVAEIVEKETELLVPTA